MYVELTEIHDKREPEAADQAPVTRLRSMLSVPCYP